MAFVFIEAGEILDLEILKNELENNYYNYQLNSKEEVEEIATFYIGEKWLGVKASEIVESISINNLEVPISMEHDHHFKGTIAYKNFIVSVLDISPFVKNNSKSEEKNDIIIVTYEGAVAQHTIGIVVDKLGEIMRVPKSHIKPFDKHLIGGGMLGESIVKPPEDNTSKNLLTLLNISKIGSLNE